MVERPKSIIDARMADRKRRFLFRQREVVSLRNSSFRIAQILVTTLIHIIIISQCSIMNVASMRISLQEKPHSDSMIMMRSSSSSNANTSNGDEEEITNNLLNITFEGRCHHGFSKEDSELELEIPYLTDFEEEMHSIQKHIFKAFPESESSDNNMLFWYGEEELEEELLPSASSSSSSSRRLKGGMRGRAHATHDHDDDYATTTASTNAFRSTCSLLRYNKTDTDGVDHEFIAGSISTHDRVIDITTLPSGEISFEVKKWDQFPDRELEDVSSNFGGLTKEEIREIEGDEEFDDYFMFEFEYEEDYEEISYREQVANGNKSASDYYFEDMDIGRGNGHDFYQMNSLPTKGNSVASDRIFVDIIVLYTRRAMCAQARLHDTCKDTPNNRGPIEARIELAVSETNTAYRFSNVKSRIRLAHTELEPDYDDTGPFARSLIRFKDKSDEHMNQIHELREEYKADLALLVIESTEMCGLAYNYRDADSQFGFSATSRSCMTGYYSFGHELAHNMGCNHNRERTRKKHEYAHGYQDPEQIFRTIMSYKCVDKKCPRVNRYSNPDLLYNGEPMGTQTENNAKQLNMIASTIANWYINPDDVVEEEEDTTHAPTMLPTTQIPTVTPTTLYPTLLPTETYTTIPTWTPTKSKFPTWRPTTLELPPYNANISASNTTTSDDYEYDYDYYTNKSSTSPTPTTTTNSTTYVSNSPTSSITTTDRPTIVVYTETFNPTVSPNYADDDEHTPTTTPLIPRTSKPPTWIQTNNPVSSASSNFPTLGSTEKETTTYEPSLEPSMHPSYS